MSEVYRWFGRSCACGLAVAVVLSLPAGVQAGQGPHVGGTRILTHVTSVQGTAWNADNSPIPAARLRLRNVISGKIAAAAVADQSGQFTFPEVQPGTYLVELVDESGRILSTGQVFTISSGETVATFVRLGTKVPWFSGFFSNAAAAAALTAASEGITALAPVARPVSAGK